MDLNAIINVDPGYYDFSSDHAHCQVRRNEFFPTDCFGSDSSTVSASHVAHSAEFPYYRNILAVDEILEGLRPRSRAASCAGPMDPATITSAGSDPSPLQEPRTTSTVITAEPQLAFLWPNRHFQTRSGGGEAPVSSASGSCGNAASASASTSVAAARCIRSRTATHDGTESTAAGTEPSASDATRGSTGTGMSSSCCRDTAQSKDEGTEGREDEADEEASSSGVLAFANSGRPSRHLWLGNLLQRATQADVEAVFSLFGTVESVRVFPSKPSSYGFVNYPTVEAATAAKAALEGRPAPALTGPKPLLIRYQQRAQHHPTRQKHNPVPRDLSSLGHPTAADVSGPSTSSGSSGRARSHSNTSQRRPSHFLDQSAAAGHPELLPPGEDFSGSPLLVDMAGHGHFEDPAGLAALLAGLGSLGFDLDVPGAESSGSTASARGGDASARGVASAPISAATAAPFGSDAGGAPHGSSALGAHGAAGQAQGHGQVQGGIRSSSSSGRLEEGAGAQGPAPHAQVELATSRHLWLGNMLSTADVTAVEQAFTPFGPLESIRLFPERNFAFVNFMSSECASAARSTLNGRPLPSLTGAKPMEIRFQTRPPHHMHLGASRASVGPSSSSTGAAPRRSSHPPSPPLGAISPPLSAQDAAAADALQPRLRSLLHLQLKNPQGDTATARGLASGASGLNLPGSSGGSFSGPHPHLPVMSGLSGHDSPPVGDLDPATVMATTPPYFMYGPLAAAAAAAGGGHPHQRPQMRPGAGPRVPLELSQLNMLLNSPATAAASDLAAMSRAAHSQLLQALALEPRGSAGSAGAYEAQVGAAAAASAAAGLWAAAGGAQLPPGWDAGWGLDGFGAAAAAGGQAGPASSAAATAAALGAAPSGWPAALAAARMSAPAEPTHGVGLGAAGAQSPLWLGGGGAAQQDPMVALAQAAAWLQQEQQHQQHQQRQAAAAVAARDRALAAALFAQHQQHQAHQQHQQRAAAAAAAAAAAGVDALLEPSGDATVLPGMLPQHYRC